MKNLFLFSIFYIFFRFCSNLSIFLGQNHLALQDGSESNPYSSLNQALNSISNLSVHNEIELMIKDSLFDNNLYDSLFEIKKITLKIKLYI